MYIHTCRRGSAVVPDAIGVSCRAAANVYRHGWRSIPLPNAMLKTDTVWERVCVQLLVTESGVR